MGSYSYHECDSCGQQAGGYSQAELTKQGWNWHPIPGTLRKFVCCDDREHEYSIRRAAKREIESLTR